jgi:arylsulfatase A
MSPLASKPLVRCAASLALGATVALAFHLAVPASAAAETASRDNKPNLIVLMADDLGAHELGCYGHPKHRTPNLDRMAHQGARFETCYSTPICHPTRFEIMTGQYGHHNGVYQFPGRPGGPKHGAPEDVIVNHVTFAQVLRPHGYATAMAGKWQLSGKVPTLVFECGFDEYLMWAYDHNLPPGVKHTGGREFPNRTSRYWHPSLMKNGKYLPTDIDDYGPDMFTDFVIDFIGRHRDEPFFVYYPMALTHSPYYPTPDMNPADADKFKHSRKHWQANVEYTDKLVGRLVAALEELGLDGNTVILFTGDNGTGGHGKGQPTERGARVPMIAYGPGLVKKLGTRRELVDLSDVFPTLMDFAGAPLPEDTVIDGHSFAPLLRGESYEPREWIYSYLGDRRIVRTETWLLENNSPDRRGRLFDCGDCRDGSRYREVTDAQEPEVKQAWAMMEKILADKPVPAVHKKAKKKPGRTQRGKKQKAAAKSR